MGQKRKRLEFYRIDVDFDITHTKTRHTGTQVVRKSLEWTVYKSTGGEIAVKVTVTTTSFEGNRRNLTFVS